MDQDGPATTDALALVNALVRKGQPILAQALSRHLMARLEPQQVAEAVLAFQQDTDASLCQESTPLLDKLLSGSPLFFGHIVALLRDCTLLGGGELPNKAMEALRLAFAADARHGAAFLRREQQWRRHDEACSIQERSLWQSVKDASDSSHVLVGSYWVAEDGEVPKVRIAWKLTGGMFFGTLVQIASLAVGSQLQPLRAPSDTAPCLPYTSDAHYFKRCVPGHGVTIWYTRNRDIKAIVLDGHSRWLCWDLDGVTGCIYAERSSDFSDQGRLFLKSDSWDCDRLCFTPLPHTVRQRWPDTSRALVELSSCGDHPLGTACARMHSGGKGGGFEQHLLPLLRAYLTGDGDPAEDALAFCKPILDEYPVEELPAPPCICQDASL